MNEELIKNEIQNGLLQIDSTFTITDFFLDFNAQTRKLECSFVAKTENGEQISEVLNYD